MPIRSFCRNCRADRLTAIRRPGCRVCQACACAQASSSTHSPSGMMRPVSSAIGMNSAGDMRRWSDLRPAQQRFGAADPRRGEVDQRLVVQRELAVLERAPQVGLGRQAAAHALGHLRAEELVVGAPRLLGVIHRGVGVAHQRLGGVAVARIERDADAAVGVQLVLGDRERLRELGQDAARHAGGLAGVGDVGEADDELVAAEARRGVLFAQAVA